MEYCISLEAACEVAGSGYPTKHEFASFIKKKQPWKMPVSYNRYKNRCGKNSSRYEKIL